MLEETLPPPPNGLSLGLGQPANPSLIAEADRTARYWSFPAEGPITIGSDLHKQATCQMFLETFNPYKPTIIDWPKLDPEARARLISLPIWDIAVQTEGKARQRMLAYAESLSDPSWRGTIAQNGWEEGRHKLVLLDSRGKQLSSEELAEFLEREQIGAVPLLFAVGGSDGFSEETRKHAGFTLSLGKMTLPHELARVVLMEQIYRAFTILKHHPYHLGH